MICYCVNLTSVYRITVGKFLLILCQQLFIISVLFLKGCPLFMLQFRISHLNNKGSTYCLHCKKACLIIFHVISGVLLCFLISQNSFDSSVSFLCLMWLSDVLWFPKPSLNVVSHEPR